MGVVYRGLVIGSQCRRRRRWWSQEGSIPLRKCCRLYIPITQQFSLYKNASEIRLTGVKLEAEYLLNPRYACSLKNKLIKNSVFAICTSRKVNFGSDTIGPHCSRDCMERIRGCADVYIHYIGNFILHYVYIRVSAIVFLLFT